MIGILRTAVQALPYLISGAQVIFSAYKQFNDIKPGQVVQIPTGYALTQSPNQKCFQLYNTQQSHRACCAILPHRYTVLTSGQRKQIIARVVNAGHQTISIRKGQQICKGVVTNQYNISVSEVNGNQTLLLVGKKQNKIPMKVKGKQWKTKQQMKFDKQNEQLEVQGKQWETKQMSLDEFQQKQNSSSKIRSSYKKFKRISKFK